MNTLALQGGGTRGQWQAAWLLALEGRVGPLANYFDLLGMTSVGSINGAAVAAGLSMAVLNNFYAAEMPAIFSRPWYQPALSRLWDSAKYSAGPLEGALLRMLGVRTLADCRTRFIATACDMVSRRPVYFQSWGTSYDDENEIVLAPDSGIKLWEVCRASSAAQSYFPGFAWRNYLFWDGGNTGLNNPAMLVLSEAKMLKPVAEIAMISLGAGRPLLANRHAADYVNPGVSRLLADTLDIVYALPETVMDWLAEQELGSRYARVNPVLAKNYALDDASPATRSALLAAAATV